MPRQSTANPTSDWGKYVAQVLAKHGLNPRSQRIRTQIPHSTVDGWLRDIPPSYPNALKFAQGMGEDVDEALRMAGFAPLPGPTSVKEMMEQRQAQESPNDRFNRRLGEAAKILVPAGFRVSPPALGSHRGQFRTDEEADAAFNSWLDDVEEDNPGKELPEGLRGEE